MELNESEREKHAKLERIRVLGIDPFPPRAQWIDQRVMAAEAARRAGATTGHATMDDMKSSAVSSQPSAFAVMGRVVR